MLIRQASANTRADELNRFVQAPPRGDFTGKTMRRLLIAATLFAASIALAEDKQEKKGAKDASLGKKGASVAPDKSLAGDLTRKKEDKGQAAPALQYDTFRLGVELQLSTKRHQQIVDLKEIIRLTPDDESGRKERPKLLFRLGELYWEESKDLFFQGNRKDDDLINAMNRKDTAAVERAKSEKEDLVRQSKEQSRLATDQYSEIVQRYKNFDRTDEVLYFLGHNLMETGDERKSLVAYKRLTEKYKKSRYIPDAYLAFGEYYFNNSKGKKDMLEKALDAYKQAASFPENQVYGYAMYKEGWTLFNLGDCTKSMDMFKTVVLYGKLAGEAAVEKEGASSKGKASLVREARNDYVRSFARCGGSPSDARAEFAKVADKPEDRFIMMKQLAALFYEDGKDKEAALAFNMLIKEKPLSPEAPGWQGKIVDCVLRAGNKKMTVEQVRRLIKLMDDINKSGSVKEEKDKKALDEARELSERTISNLAVNWHNECKKTRDDETCGLASEVYGDYLTLFPDNSKAYALRFFWAELLNDTLQKFDRASEEYTKVLLVDIPRIDKGEKAPSAAECKKATKPGCFTVNAAYNAILAYDEVVKKLVADGKLKTETVTDINKKLAIPPAKQALLDACERYLKYVPHGEKQVEIAFKVAKIYYDHNHLDEAIKRFTQIAIDFPDYKFEDGGRAGEISYNLVLDSYNLLKDWAKVNEMARKFYAVDKLAVGKGREDLAKLIEQSAFTLVNQLEAKKDFCRAADAYVGFVTEFPTSEIADKALYNGSIDFFNCKQLDKAIETRKRIIKDYPRSEFVPACIFATAEGYEAIADFENAADSYERYASAYEKSQAGGGKTAGKRAPAKKKGAKAAESAPAGEHPQVWEEAKAQVGYFNAGVFRDGLGQYKQALRDREKYLDLWGAPDKKGEMSKDAEAVFLSIADLHEKNGAYGKAIKQLEDYEKKVVKDPNRLLTTEGRIATINEDRLRSQKGARKVFERVLTYYEKLPSKAKKGLEITALDAVARAHFVTSEDTYKKYLALKLKWSKLTNINEFKKSVKDMAAALEGIQKVYTTTVTFKSADPAICALDKIGQAYDHFAHALVNAPTPKGMPEDLLVEFKSQLESQAQPIKDKAKEAFDATVKKSQEFDIYNGCTTHASKWLADNDPDAHPKMREEVLEVKGEFKVMAIGGDLLASVQAIPTVQSEAGPSSKVPGTPVVVDKTPPPEVDDTPPPPSPPNHSKPAPAPAPTPATKAEEPSEEPL